METNVTVISALENEKAIDLIQRMLEMKSETQKEIKCVLGGCEFTTEGSNTLEEMLVHNSTSIFQNFESSREELLNTPEMQQVIGSFQNGGRGKRFETATAEDKKIASRNFEREAEFRKKRQELETLDYSNASSVLSWLNSIAEYINDHDLHLPVSNEFAEYSTISNYIVKKLEEKGYHTVENSPIENMNDYYKKLISYYLDDLDKYQFFAYQYAMNSNEEKKEMQQVAEVSYHTEIENIELELQEIQKRKRNVRGNFNRIVGIEKGLIDEKGNKLESFDSRKSKIAEQIKQLEEEREKRNEQFKQSSNSVVEPQPVTQTPEPASMNFSNASVSDQEFRFLSSMMAMNQMKQPENNVKSENQQKEENTVSSQPQNPFSNPESQQQLQFSNSFMALKEKEHFENMDRINKEIENLKQQSIALENVQSTLIMSFKPKKDSLKRTYESLKLKEQELNEKLAQLKQGTTTTLEEQENENIQPSQPEESDLPELPVPGSVQKDSNQEYYQRLEEVAQEGNIFQDESKNRTFKTQVANEEEVENSSHLENIPVPEEEIELPDLPTPSKDSFHIAHVIQFIKKASNHLIAKVRSKKAVQSQNEVLRKLKQYKVAATALLATSVIGVGIGAIASNIGSEYINNDLPQVTAEDITTNPEEQAVIEEDNSQVEEAHESSTMDEIAQEMENVEAIQEKVLIKLL